MTINQLISNPSAARAWPRPADILATYPRMSWEVRRESVTSRHHPAPGQETHADPSRQVSPAATSFHVRAQAGGRCRSCRSDAARPGAGNTISVGHGPVTAGMPPSPSLQMLQVLAAEPRNLQARGGAMGGVQPGRPSISLLNCTTRFGN